MPQRRDDRPRRERRNDAAQALTFNEAGIGVRGILKASFKHLAAKAGRRDAERTLSRASADSRRHALAQASAQRHATKGASNARNRPTHRNHSNMSTRTMRALNKLDPITVSEARTAYLHDARTTPAVTRYAIALGLPGLLTSTQLSAANTQAEMRIRGPQYREEGQHVYIVAIKQVEPYIAAPLASRLYLRLRELYGLIEDASNIADLIGGLHSMRHIANRVEELSNGPHQSFALGLCRTRADLQTCKSHALKRYDTVFQASYCLTDNDAVRDMQYLTALSAKVEYSRSSLEGRTHIAKLYEVARRLEARRHLMSDL